MQADLAYAAERITHDYPEPTGAKKAQLSTVSDYFRNIRTHSIHPRVSVGYDFGGWRIAADYARYRKWNNNKYSVNIENVEKHDNGNRIDRKTENQENGTFHAVSSLGLSTVYDFRPNDKFKPYIGVRVGYGHVRHQVRSVQQETEIVTTYPSDGSAKTSVPSKMPPKPAYHENRSSRRLGFGA
ncbi:Opacity protein opA54, partial [Neisseria gonorrhoeae]